jgi:hypothetical protein
MHKNYTSTPPYIFITCGLDEGELLSVYSNICETMAT